MFRSLTVAGAAVLLLLLAVAPRGAKAASSLPIPVVAGSWTGEVDDIFDGIGDLNLTVIETRRRLTGFWTLSFLDAGFAEGGELLGHVTPAGTVVVRLRRPGACAVRALGQVVSLDPVNGEISGNYLSCHHDSGFFDITR